MKNDMNQEDEFLKALFQTSEKRPTSSMSEQVMQRIDRSSELFEYKPVITKNAWVIIGCVFSIVLIYLFLQTGDFSLKTPELITMISNGFIKLTSSFSLDLSQIEFPKIPTSILAAILAINVVGIYFMISYRWSRKIFK